MKDSYSPINTIGRKMTYFEETEEDRIELLKSLGYDVESMKKTDNKDKKKPDERTK